MTQKCLSAPVSVSFPSSGMCSGRIPLKSFTVLLVCILDSSSLGILQSSLLSMSQIVQWSRAGLLSVLPLPNWGSKCLSYLALCGCQGSEFVSTCLQRQTLYWMSHLIVLLHISFLSQAVIPQPHCLFSLVFHIY